MQNLTSLFRINTSHTFQIQYNLTSYTPINSVASMYGTQASHACPERPALRHCLGQFGKSAWQRTPPTNTFVPHSRFLHPIRLLRFIEIIVLLVDDLAQIINNHLSHLSQICPPIPT